ncbi:MAG: nucleotide exchange factor GrpE [Thermodesulfobacteriota bacterium]
MRTPHEGTTRQAPSEQKTEANTQPTRAGSEEKADLKEPAEKPIESMTKEELMEAFKEMKEKAAKNYDLYLRSLAEIENMKKRNAKEKEEWMKYSNESLIKDILPALDNLEKALTHAQEGNALPGLREGVDLTLKGLKEGLGKSGVKEVGALGLPFDPCFHQAVSQMEEDGVEAGLVLQELQKGYLLNGRLIRPSMVVVSRGKTSMSVEESSEGLSCEES